MPERWENMTMYVLRTKEHGIVGAVVSASHASLLAEASNTVFIRQCDVSLELYDESEVLTVYQPPHRETRGAPLDDAGKAYDDDELADIRHCIVEGGGNGLRVYHITRLLATIDADRKARDEQTRAAYYKGRDYGKRKERDKREKMIEGYIERARHWKERAKTAEGQLRAQRNGANHGITDHVGPIHPAPEPVHAEDPDSQLTAAAYAFFTREVGFDPNREWCDHDIDRLSNWTNSDPEKMDRYPQTFRAGAVWGISQSAPTDFWSDLPLLPFFAPDEIGVIRRLIRILKDKNLERWGVCQATLEKLERWNEALLGGS
jgi:hypothetical protein